MVYAQVITYAKSIILVYPERVVKTSIAAYYERVISRAGVHIAFRWRCCFFQTAMCTAVLHTASEVRYGVEEHTIDCCSSSRQVL